MYFIENPQQIYVFNFITSYCFTFVIMKEFICVVKKEFLFNVHCVNTLYKEFDIFK